MNGNNAKRQHAVEKMTKRVSESAKLSRVKKVLFPAVSFVLIVAMVISYVVVFRTETVTPVVLRNAGSTEVTKPTEIVPVVRSAQTLNDLMKMPVELLGNMDVAEMNLLCATDLPGAENLDIDHALATLDQWAKRVAYETDRHLYRVKDPRYAEHYRHSEAYLRAEMLLQTLQENLDVKYDMNAKDNFDFDDSRVAFIHGMIPMPGQTVKDTPGGTCASMPVLYVAVGRRLGYPIRLVTTNGHLFARWDGEDHSNPAWRERFNIEGSGEGFSSYEDDHYKTWPFPNTDEQIKENRYLISLTPQEELAEFMAARGHCGRDNGQPAFAARCYENAYRYDPTRPAYRDWFLDVAVKSGYQPVTPDLAQALFYRLHPGHKIGPHGNIEAPMVRRDMDAEIERINAINQGNMQHVTSQSPDILQPLTPPPRYPIPRVEVPTAPRPVTAASRIPIHNQSHQPHQPPR